MRVFNSLTSTILSLSALSLAAGSIASGQTPPPPLDYARTLEGPQLIFVPYVGSNRGPVYYTEYQQVPTSTAAVGELRRMFVNLFPTAHLRNLYDAFVRQHDISDARIDPVPETGTCQPSDEILELLKGMPTGFRPRVLGGNYPIVCSLSLWFLPEDESRVRAVIAERPVIVLRAEVPLCSPQSPRVDVPAIVAQLRAAGLLADDGSGTLSGGYDELVAALTDLAASTPTLFGGDPPQQGLDVLLALFTVENGTARIDAITARRPTYVCRPSPLAIQFG
jgi:hypothetical protein